MKARNVARCQRDKVVMGNKPAQHVRCKEVGELLLTNTDKGSLFTNHMSQVVYVYSIKVFRHLNDLGNGRVCRFCGHDIDHESVVVVFLS